MVIYKITNTINQKIYIGQTVDFHHRMIAHKSDANNKKCHSYKLPLYRAIRKYGWDNFTKEIIEECPEGLTYEEEVEWANEKEVYYISQYNSTLSDNGYNISPGGSQSPKGKLSFEEKVALSSILTLEEVKDIQQLLLSGEEKQKILDKYAPKLKESFLDNINAGTNFYNPELSYPLFDYLHCGFSVKLAREEQRMVQSDIASGMKYSDITKKWNISPSLISLINNGSIWHSDELTYPLCIKGTSRLHNWEDWVKPMIYDLENSDMNLIEIHEKYNKAYSTVKKINEGRSYRDDTKQYPLTKHRKK